MVSSKRKKPELANKITLRWVYENVPLHFWKWVVGALIVIVTVAFKVGYEFGQKTNTYESITRHNDAVQSHEPVPSEPDLGIWIKNRTSSQPSDVLESGVYADIGIIDSMYRTQKTSDGYYMFIEDSSFENWRLDKIYPELSIQVVNNSNETVLISKAIVGVDKSMPLSSPLLTIESGGCPVSIGGFFVKNEGWEAAKDVILNFSIFPFPERRAMEIKEVILS